MNENKMLLVKHLFVLRIFNHNLLDAAFIKQQALFLKKQYAELSPFLNINPWLEEVNEAEAYCLKHIAEINKIEINNATNDFRELIKLQTLSVIEYLKKDLYDNEGLQQVNDLSVDLLTKLVGLNRLIDINDAFNQYLIQLKKIKNAINEAQRKASKRFLRLVIDLSALLFVVVFFAVFIWSPNIRYHKALDAMQNGDYEYAINTFTKLNDYADSPTQLKLVKVYQACNNGDYELAIKLMQEVGLPYEVSYNTQGGKLLDGDPITAELKGYKFLSFSLKEYSFEEQKLYLKLKANYQLITYNITYISSDVINSNATYDVLSTFILPRLSKFGYIFKGWNSTDAKYEDLLYINPGMTGDLELYPHFVPEEYQLIINLDNGTLPSDVPTSYNLETNSLHIGQPYKAGYTFVGWTSNFQSEPTLEIDIEQGSFGTVQLSAHYVPNTYQISYELNGGTGPMVESYQTDDATKLVEPIKRGYDFVGWTDEEHNEPIKDYPLSYGDLNLTANYVAKTYRIHYDPRGGNLDGEYEDVTYDEVYELNEPTRAGYDFVGWYYSGIKYENGIYRYDDDITLTASWKPRNDVNYVVRHFKQDLSLDGYTIAEVEHLRGTADAIIKPNVMNYDGFSVPPVQTVQVDPHGFLEVNYYYDRISYKVQCYTNGGNTQEVKYFYYEEFIDVADPTRSGYTFGGWYLDSALTINFNQALMPANNVELYAWWMEEAKPSIFNYVLIDNNDETPMEYFIITGVESTSLNKIVIPSYIGDILVGQIDDYAFISATNLAEVTIPETIFSIGYQAFNQANLIINISTKIPYQSFVDWCDSTSIIITY